MVAHYKNEFSEGQACPQHSVIKNFQLVCVSIQYFFRPEAMTEPDRKFSLHGSRPKNIFQTDQNLNLLSVLRI